MHAFSEKSYLAPFLWPQTKFKATMSTTFSLHWASTTTATAMATVAMVAMAMATVAMAMAMATVAMRYRMTIFSIWTILGRIVLLMMNVRVACAALSAALTLAMAMEMAMSSTMATVAMRYRMTICSIWTILGRIVLLMMNVRVACAALSAALTLAMATAG
jgi:hypothetical protein